MIGGYTAAASTGMLIVNRPLPCYHLETDGSDVADLPNRDVLVQHETTSRPAKVHGCLPADADLAFALGTLKQGGLDPASGAAHLTSDPVVRHEVFAAFNKCLVRYLTEGIGARVDVSTPAGLRHDDADRSGCQLCDVVSWLALHSSECREHHIVCSDRCLPLYNLICYHLVGSGGPRSPCCDASLCGELRTALLQGQPMELRSHGLDRAWYRLRSRLSGMLLPRQRVATPEEVLELVRRMAGSRPYSGAGAAPNGGGGGGGTHELSSAAADAAAAAHGRSTADASDVRLRRRGGSSGSDMPVAPAAGARRGAATAADRRCSEGSVVSGDCSDDDNGGSGRSSSSSSSHASADFPVLTLPPPSTMDLLFVSGSIPTGDELERRFADAGGEFGQPAAGRAALSSAAAARAGLGSGSSSRRTPVGPSAGGSGSDAGEPVEASLSSLGSRTAAADSHLLPRLSVLLSSAQSTADGDELVGIVSDVLPGESHEPAMQLVPALNLLDAGRRPMIGRGHVAYGEPRHLLELVQYWRSLQERLQDGLPLHDVADGCDTDVWEGIILTGKDCQLKLQDGNYQKRLHWTKQTFLGRGISGRVHLAIDNATEFSFVSKKVELHDFTHEELSVWAELEHPGIVQLYGALRHGQKLYYLCEFYAGGTLSALVQRSRALDQWKALLYMDQILNALAYLHEKKIIHEDLKADNIFLKLESHVLGIGDFGLSCKLRPGQNSVVAGKQPLGGQTQWSPEKARSEGHGFAADVWAATCTMVHMLSGHHPWEQRFKGCHMLHFVIAINSPPMDDVPHGLLDDVMDLIVRGWTMEPHRRPPASELLQHQCFGHLQNGLPGDPKYTSHFPHLQFVPDDVSDSYPVDQDEELDEDGENYMAEIVEKVRRASTGHDAAAARGAGSIGARSEPGCMLWTEHDIRSSAAAVATAVTASGSNDLADCEIADSFVGQPQPDTISEGESSGSPIRLEWNRAAAQVGSKEWSEKGMMTLPARPRCEAIEEERLASSLSGGIWMEPSSSTSSPPPLLNAIADAASLSSSSSSASSATTIGGGAGKQKRRNNPGLYVNVRGVTSPTSDPVSPSRQQIRHSHSLDSGQSMVTPPPSSAGSVGSGSEGKPRSLKHTATSPSILTTLHHGVVSSGEGGEQQRPQQRRTPQSAGGSSIALRSADLSTAGALAPALPLPDVTLKRLPSTASSSAYGSGTPLLHLQSTPPSDGPASARARSSTPGSRHEGAGPSSSPSAAAARGPATRDVSQGYGSGCSTAAPESAGSVFTGYGDSPRTERSGSAAPRLSLPFQASSSQHTAGTSSTPGRQGATAPRLRHATLPAGSSTELLGVTTAADSFDKDGVTSSPCLSSSPAANGDGRWTSVLQPRQDSGTTISGSTAVQAVAGPTSLANTDTSFGITISDCELEMIDLQPVTDSAGTRGTDLVTDVFDLRLPDDLEQGPRLEKDESSSDDEEYLSMLKQSLKQSGSLNSPHAVFIAGDRCYALSKDQEIGKLKLSHDMTWQDAVQLMSIKVHKGGFESFTVLHDDGRELHLHEKIPFQTVTLIVRTASEGGPWQWWITNGVIRDNDEDGHHGPFLDSRP